MNKNIKYLILDFGKVLAGPGTENWFLTPNFYKIIGINEIDLNKFEKAIQKCDSIISRKMKNEEDEYKAFCEVYYNVLKIMGYEKNIEENSKKVAYDFVFNDNKFSLYLDTKENLERLSKKYKLILLSDNWPSVYRVMKNWKIDVFFDNIYVSSIYKETKKDKVFFDYPINEYNIKKDEAIFVDDNIELLKIAEEKGLLPILMDRENEIKECKYKVIKSLKEII